MALPTAPGEFASGAVFGTALLLSGVYVPRVIQAQLLFTSTHMLQVFLGGSAASALVLDLADRTGLSRKTHRPPASLGLFPYDGNLLGGALIGLGMATTGACPGTSLVQLGTGMANGALVVLGGLVGAGLFVRVKGRILKETAVSAPSDSPPPVTASSKTPPPLAETGPTDPPPNKILDMPTALSIQPSSMLLLWIPMCLTVIALAHTLDRRRARYSTTAVLPPAYGGLLIGIAQAASILLTRHHVGASSAYEDLARWITHKLSFRRDTNSKSPPASLVTPSLIFSAGIVCATATMKQLGMGVALAPAERFAPSLPFVARAIAGGASMVFGARLAGGCTSGHGISGLSKFSLASLATTAAIFGGGMLSAQLIPI